MLDALKFDITAAFLGGPALDRVKKDLGDVRGALRGVADTARDVGRSMRNIGLGLSAAVTAPLALIGRQSLGLYGVQERAQAAVTAAVESTGGAAGLTADELFRMASGLQAVSTFGDEAILQKVTAPLLTFTQVAGDEFGRAQQAVLDMSALLGTDLKAAAMQVGKALNDPVRGVSALAEAGVQFSEDQRAMIRSLAETGQVAAAQSIILDELERQFGGQAAALAGTVDGQMTQIANAVGDLKESLGEQIVPFLVPLLDTLRDAVRWFGELSPEVRQNIVVFGGLAAAVGPVLSMLGLAAIGVGGLITAFTGLAAAVMANPVFAALGLVAAAAFLIYQNWEPISEWFGRQWAAIKAYASAFWDWFKGFLDRWTPQIVKDAWGALPGWFSVLFSAVTAGLTLSWETIKGWFARAWNAAAIVHRYWQDLPAWFGDLWSQVRAAFAAAWESIKTLFPQWIEDMKSLGRDMVAGLVEGIRESAPAAGSPITGLALYLSRRFSEELGIRSPSRVFRGYGQNIVEGLSLGIEENIPMVEAGMSRLTGAMGMGGLGQAAGQVEGAFRSAFTNIVTGAQSAGDALGGLLRQLSTVLANQAFQMLWSGGGGGKWWQGGGGGFGLGGLIGKLFGFADGGALAMGRPIPFATGGVVGGPTLFPMAGGRTGLMGEAGPEAILPLARVGGRLGVRAEGGGQVEVVVRMDGEGNLTPVIARVSGNVVARAAPGIVQSAVGAVAEIQRETRLVR